MSVCGACGVPIASAKTGRLVHLSDIPDGINPDHEIVSVPETDFRVGAEARITLKAAAEDMIHHHATLHPDSGCPWAETLRRALRSA
jgi:hypothetical protein